MKIELYHGSENIIPRPVVGAGNPRNDYGLGFYCTKSVELAWEWASKGQALGYANHYELEMRGLDVLRLGSDKYHILNWLALLLKNREFDIAAPLPSQIRDYILETFLPAGWENYDVIVGYRADDSYFAFAKSFLNNTISLGQLQRAMKLGRLGQQTVLKSSKAFERLHFIEALPIDGTIYGAKRRARDEAAREEFLTIKKEIKAEDEILAIDILRQKWTDDDARLQ